MTLAYALTKTGHPNCRRPDKVIDAGQAVACLNFPRQPPGRGRMPWHEEHRKAVYGKTVCTV